MTLTVFPRAEDFLAAAGAFLAEREAENNLILGLAATLAERPDRYGDQPPYLAVVAGDGGDVKVAALRTPPYNLVLSVTDELSALEPVAADLRARGEALPGVLARSDVAEGFATRWERATGTAARLNTAERIYQLEKVTPPAAMPGRLVRAETSHRDLLVEWLDAFAAEAQDIHDRARAERQVDFGLAGGAAALWLWCGADGRPVSVAGSGGPTPTGIRIGPVYTPPPLRRRGYAGALVAGLSQHHLDTGRARCFLFTNLANPTSNSIYQAIGYRPVCDVSEIVFEPGGA